MKIRASQQVLFFCFGLIASAISGCLAFQQKTLYNDSEVSVVFHQPFSVQGLDSDSRHSSAYVELTVGKHSYKLADLIDREMKGFLRTADGNAIVFVTENGKGGQGWQAGTLHVVNLVTKTDVAVPLAIRWHSWTPKMSVLSYDDRRLVIFVDPNGSTEIGGTLEIDLQAKQVLRFDRSNSPARKPAPVP